MIRAVANKRLDLNDSEFKYFNSLKQAISSDDFKGLFDSDINGIITAITPPLDRSINIAVIYFMLNVMVNQRMRMIGNVVKNFENNIDESAAVTSLIERVERLEKIIGDKNELSS